MKKMNAILDKDNQWHFWTIITWIVQWFTITGHNNEKICQIGLSAKKNGIIVTAYLGVTNRKRIH